MCYSDAEFFSQSIENNSSLTTCASCGEPNASICCRYCGDCFHWRCSQVVWRKGDEETDEEKESKSCRNPPDALTWPYYVCSRSECARYLRQKERLITRELFASPAGVRSRDWLVMDRRHRGNCNNRSLQPLLQVTMSLNWEMWCGSFRPNSRPRQ